MSNQTAVEPTAIFKTKDHGPLNRTTRFLEIEHDANNPPPPVIQDFRQAGWQTDGDRGFAPIPPAPRIMGDGSLNYNEVVATTHLTKPGSDLFGGWTPDECKRNMAEARRILRKHGWTNVPTHRLTLEELL